MIGLVPISEGKEQYLGIGRAVIYGYGYEKEKEKTASHIAWKASLAILYRKA